MREEVAREEPKKCLEGRDKKVEQYVEFKKMYSRHMPRSQCRGYTFEYCDNFIYCHSINSICCVHDP